jgi:hypothetical protein
MGRWDLKLRTKIIIVLAQILAAIVIFTVIKDMRKQVMEEARLPVKGTVWLEEGREKKVIQFVEENIVMIRDRERKEIKMYEYDFEKTESEGVIYLQGKREGRLLMQNYTKGQLADWDMIKIIKRDGNRLKIGNEDYKKIRAEEQ